jgi:hypothetical protein
MRTALVSKHGISNSALLVKSVVVATHVERRHEIWNFSVKGEEGKLFP